MANLVNFNIRVKGKKDACNVVFKSLQKGEWYTKKEINIKGCDYIFVTGECNNGLDAYTTENVCIDDFCIDAVNDLIVEKIRNITLQAKSKLLCCEIEAFEFYDDEYVIHHVRYCNGEELIDEKVNLSGIKEVTFDEETRELDCSKAFTLGTDDETIKKYVVDSVNSNYEEDDSDDYELIMEPDVIYGYEGKKKELTIPSWVTKIGEDCFSGNKKLISVTIPSSVKEIDNYAFENCVNLKEVILENPTVELGISTFEGCKKLQKGDFIIIGTVLVQYVGKDKEVVVPEYIDVISSFAFYENLSVTKIVLGEKVRWIGTEAFSGCSNLEEINVPEKAIVGEYAFEGCEMLSKGK